jgi:hypothetical protein
VLPIDFFHIDTEGTVPHYMRHLRPPCSLSSFLKSIG